MEIFGDFAAIKFIDNMIRYPYPSICLLPAYHLFLLGVITTFRWYGMVPGKKANHVVVYVVIWARVYRRVVALRKPLHDPSQQLSYRLAIDCLHFVSQQPG